MEVNNKYRMVTHSVCINLVTEIMIEYSTFSFAVEVEHFDVTSKC